MKKKKRNNEKKKKKKKRKKVEETKNAGEWQWIIDWEKEEEYETLM